MCCTKLLPCRNFIAIKTNKTVVVFLLLSGGRMVRTMYILLILFFFFGTLELSSASAQTILVDSGHGERFKIDDDGPLQLSRFAEMLQATGAHVATLAAPISDASLAEADSLIISGAFVPLKADEIEALVRFLNRGGRLAVMLHIAPPLVSLLERLKVSYTNGVIQERENVIDGADINFRVNRLGTHQILQGVGEFNLYGAWGLMNQDETTRVIASTSPMAWIDLDRSKIQRKEATASFGVTVAGDVGKGGFLVFGDDAIFQNKFLSGTNKVLAANLADWLK